jgi:hypothetical protein
MSICTVQQFLQQKNLEVSMKQYRTLEEDTLSPLDWKEAHQKIPLHAVEIFSRTVRLFFKPLLYIGHIFLCLLVGSLAHWLDCW